MDGHLTFVLKYAIYSLQSEIAPRFQVCIKLDEDNTGREVDGLAEAMDFFSLTKATIISRDQSDIIRIGKKIIDVVPFYNWVTANNQTN